METIKGKITKIIWAGDNHSVIVSVVPSGSGKQFTALGKIENAKKGASVTLEGEWEVSPKTGQNQFKVKNAFTEVDPAETAAIRYLSSGAFKGVKEALACSIVETLGTDIRKYLGNKKKLMSVPKVGEIKADAIIECYLESASYFTPYELTGGDISLNQAKKICDKYGADVESVLKNNPYLLVYDISGFGFHKADTIALKSGHKYDGKNRIYAGIICALKNAAQDAGHCFLYEDELLTRSLDLLLPLTQMSSIYYQDVLNTAIPGNYEEWRGTALASLVTNNPRIATNIVEKWGNDRKAEDNYIKKYDFTSEEIETIRIYGSKRDEFETMLKDILNSESVNLDHVAIADVMVQLFQTNTRDAHLICDLDNLGRRRYYEREVFLTEMMVAQYLVNMLAKDLSLEIPQGVIDREIDRYEKETNRTLGPEQKKAVSSFRTKRVTGITGGPGRGKTTIETIIIRAWEACGGDVLLLAPTGRAAQRMSEATGAFAMTIHRALIASVNRNIQMPDEELFGGKTLADLSAAGNKTLVIIDESSMCDMTLIRRTLKQFADCHMLFIGDANQLPCVGIGDFFDSIIKCGVVPFTRLIECYRNSGSISYNSDVIESGGRIKDLTTDHMFKLHMEEDAETTQSNVLQIYNKALGTFDKKDIAVIVPLRQRGKTSANELNRLIQEKFNPHAKNKPEIKVSNGVFRVGDRVMQTKNNYQLTGTKKLRPIRGVFNGETGEIADIKPDDITVIFDDEKVVHYSVYDISQLSLCYAITVHKSQGSEYKCVIMAFTNGDYQLLCRKIIYTAESRGKQIVYLLGNPAAIQKSMSNAYYEQRNTALDERIIKLS